MHSTEAWASTNFTSIAAAQSGRLLDSITFLETIPSLCPLCRSSQRIRICDRFIFKDDEGGGGEQIPKPRMYDGLLAAWEYNDSTDSKNSGLQVAKLGGAGLALIALVSLEKAQPGLTSLAYMRQIGEFILFMQKPDGSFYSKYIPQKGGFDKKFVSLYDLKDGCNGIEYVFFAQTYTLKVIFY